MLAEDNTNEYRKRLKKFDFQTGDILQIVMHNHMGYHKQNLARWLPARCGLSVIGTHRQVNCARSAGSSQKAGTSNLDGNKQSPVYIGGHAG
jgi:hypothetical protein